jgi:hypothetical protein
MSANALTIETFTEYGIGMLFLLVRLYARLYVGGIRGLRLDDVFAVSGMVCTVSPSVAGFAFDNAMTDILVHADGYHLSSG